MTDPIKDPEILINYPIYTPAEGEVMKNRPLYHNLMKNDQYFQKYQQYFDDLISQYFENGRFQILLRETREMIAPYVEKDPTAFCSYEDHILATDTLEQVCLLRAQSVPAGGGNSSDYPGPAGKSRSQTGGGTYSAGRSGRL